MRDNVLCRKKAHIVMLLAKALQISDEQALEYFYSTKIFKQLNNPKFGLQSMSDEYLLEDIQKELSQRDN